MENLKHDKMLNPLDQAWLSVCVLATKTPGRTIVNKHRLFGPLLQKSLDHFSKYGTPNLYCNLTPIPFSNHFCLHKYQSMSRSIKNVLMFVNYLSIVLCDVRIWSKMVSLGDKARWNDNKLPCKGQSIVLPEEVIFVPKYFIFGPETILPRNGMLLFDSKGSGMNKKDCF